MNSSLPGNYMNPIFQQQRQPQIIYHPNCSPVLYPQSAQTLKLVKVQYPSNNGQYALNTESASSVGPQTNTFNNFATVHNQQQHMVPVILMPASTQMKSSAQYRPRYVAMNRGSVYPQAMAVPLSSVRNQHLVRSDLGPLKASSHQMVVNPIQREEATKSASNLKENDGNVSPKDSENSNEIHKEKSSSPMKASNTTELDTSNKDKDLSTDKFVSKDNDSETTKLECDVEEQCDVSLPKRKAKTLEKKDGECQDVENLTVAQKIRLSKRRRISPQDSEAQLKSSTLGWSTYKGVTFHRHTKKWEAHIWATKHLYLGSFDTEAKAAKAWDRASISTKKILSDSDSNAIDLNFAFSEYAEETKILVEFNQRELVSYIRRHSCCFTRGSSKYRGVTKNRTNGRWEARLGQYAKRKYKYLGIFNTVSP